MSGTVNGHPASSEFKAQQMKRYLTEAEENALRAAGNAIRNKYRAVVYSKVRKQTGVTKRGARYKLRGKTKSVQLGFGKRSWYGHFREKGRSQVGAGIYKEIVSEDISDIRSVMAGELEALSLPEGMIAGTLKRRKLPDESSEG